MIKNDIYTAMVEQAKICSVPIEFIAMRGQGIKLLSFIAKECRKIKHLCQCYKNRKVMMDLRERLY